MGLFTSEKHEIELEAPGTLVYRESNLELSFPAYEEEGCLLVVGQPYRRRVFYFFGWYTDRHRFSAEETNRILPHLQQHFLAQGRPMRFFELPADGEENLVFHPELFEHRSRALDLLSDAGLYLFSDYGSVNLVHDRFGLEICGMPDEESLGRVIEVMERGFPHWHFKKVCDQCGSRDPGWLFKICMLPPAQSAGL